MAVNYAVVDQGAAGTTEIVAATAGKEIRVLNYTLVMDATGTLKFNDGTDDLTGAMPFAQYGGASAGGAGKPISYAMGEPLFVCGVGRPLQVTTTGGAAHGHLVYQIVP